MKLQLEVGTAARGDTTTKHKFLPNFGADPPHPTFPSRKGCRARSEAESSQGSNLCLYDLHIPAPVSRMGQGCGGRGRWAKDATSWGYCQTHGMCQGKKERGEGVLPNGHIPTGKTTRDFPPGVTCLNRREAFMHIRTANTEDGENPSNAFTLCLVHRSQGAQNSLILSRRMLPNSCLQGWRLHIHRRSLEVCGTQRQLFGRCTVCTPSPALCKPSPSSGDTCSCSAAFALP